MLRAFALIACAMAVSGCRGDGTVGDRLPRDQRIAVLFPEAIRGPLDPRLNTRAWTGKVVQLMYEGVVSIHNEAMEPRPALAARIDQPAPTVYEITLRDDARFHDGSPVTARDLEATYRSVVDPQLKSPFRGLYARVRSMEILGEKRLRITLDAPHAPFVSDLSLGIVPADRIGPDGQLTAPIGAGPYAFEARDGEREVVLKRSAHAWRGQPRTPYLVLRTVRDENTRLLALMGGDADLVQNAVTPRLVDAVRDRPDLTVQSVPGVGYNYLAFNLRDPILADLRVRRAIAHAIDRGRLITHKFRGVASPSTGLLAPNHWAHADDVPRYAHDPDRARALLDAAGHPDPPGPAPRFTLSFKTSTDKFRRNLVRLMADDLQAVGIRVDVQGFELGTLLSDAKSGNFQLYTLQWPDPGEPHFYNWLFHSDRIPTPDAPNRGGNRGAYHDPRVDGLIERGRVTTDRAARAAVYRDLQRILQADLPYVSLWHEDVVVVHRAGLEGYRPLPNASLFELWRAGWRAGAGR